MLHHGHYSYAVHDLNISHVNFAAGAIPPKAGRFAAVANYDDQADSGSGPPRQNGVVMSGLTSKLLVALILIFAASTSAGCTISCPDGLGVCGIS
ncbi:hypothetical protein A5647_17190 [Mycobacterium sp. 1100029.7]|nr:hypothetical protein A5647_17190 [Mycobacterium sp. 1100029.7]